MRVQAPDVECPVFRRHMKGARMKDSGMALEARVWPETKALALEQVAEGKLLKAIKLVRNATGSSYKEAKEYVDLLRTEVVAQRVPSETRERARGLIAEGKPVHAIKLVRDETGMGLRDAKDYVEAVRAGRIHAAPETPGPTGQGTS
jgi:ribosomal protein L7/L12